MKKTRYPHQSSKAKAGEGFVALVRDEGRSCGNGWNSMCCFVNISAADKR